MSDFAPPQRLVFFADEACISQDRYTVVGGICVHRDTMPILRENIRAYRNQHNMHAELKWSKISDQKAAEYKALVDYFFWLNNSDVVHFHCIIFDQHQAAHRRYNDGDADIGLSKLYYQLILHKFCKQYSQYEDMCVCLDHRNSSTSHDDLKRILNDGVNKSLGKSIRPIKQLISSHSHDEDLLQLNDVILGAVAAARNGKHELVGGRASKREIARMVLDKSGLATFERDSPRAVKRFTVWNMRARPR